MIAREAKKHGLPINDGNWKQNVVSDRAQRGLKTIPSGQAQENSLPINFSIPQISQMQFCPVVNFIPIRPLTNLNNNINMPLNPFLQQNIGFSGMVPFNGMMPSVSLLPQFY